MTVTVGDLVCMYRRKNKGLGLILEKVDDISEAAGIDSGAILTDLSDLKENWFEKNQYKKRVVEEATDKFAATLFLSFNGQGWCSKPKYKFVRVQWFKPPSNYENTQTSEEIAWYPADWIRKIK